MRVGVIVVGAIWIIAGGLGFVATIVEHNAVHNELVSDANNVCEPDAHSHTTVLQNKCYLAIPFGCPPPDGTPVLNLSPEVWGYIQSITLFVVGIIVVILGASDALMRNVFLLGLAGFLLAFSVVWSTVGISVLLHYQHSVCSLFPFVVWAIGIGFVYLTAILLWAFRDSDRGIAMAVQMGKRRQMAPSLKKR